MPKCNSLYFINNFISQHTNTNQISLKLYLFHFCIRCIIVNGTMQMSCHTTSFMPLCCSLPECIKPHPRVKFSSDLPTYMDVWTADSYMRTLIVRTQRFQALFSTRACWTLRLLCSVNTRTNFVQLFYTYVYSIREHFWCCSFLKSAGVYRVIGNDRHALDEKGEGERIILGFL